MIDDIRTLLGHLNDENESELGVIPWSSPVISFGDLQNSFVATVGINPSNKEFELKEYLELNTGFSIELDTSNNWKLEYRGLHDGLPLYESIGGKVTAIALVNKPAINRVAKAVEKDKKIIGLVMIPDLRMYRNVGPNGPENCYWYFSAETIRHLQESFEGKVKFGH